MSCRCLGTASPNPPDRIVQKPLNVVAEPFYGGFPEADPVALFSRAFWVQFFLDACHLQLINAEFRAAAPLQRSKNARYKTRESKKRK